MFRKFCRLELDEGVPQTSTIGRFRIALEKSGRLEVVLTEVNSQLSSQNVILQEGRVDVRVQEIDREPLRYPPLGKYQPVWVLINEN